MSNVIIPNRGDIYICDFGKGVGSVQQGKRPVLVMSNDRLNRTSSTVMVAPISSSLKKLGMKSHVMLPKDGGTGLEKPSMLVLEHQRSVSIEQLEARCGSLVDEETWRRINEGLRGLFDMGSIPLHNQRDAKDIMCLCTQCVSFYRHRRDQYYVRRHSAYNGVTGTCDRCGYPKANDYVIRERNTESSERGGSAV